jgi:DNA-binding transcriptional ArsR family regulator
MENKKMIDRKFDMFINFLEHALDVPEIFPDEVVFLPLAENEWRTVFTEKRIELIKKIVDRKPKSVNELVKLLKRHQEAVSRDLKLLENVGIVKMEPRGKNRVPSINKKIIVTPLMMPVLVKK